MNEKLVSQKSSSRIGNLNSQRETSSPEMGGEDRSNFQGWSDPFRNHTHIVFDLDDTLIRVDLLKEALIRSLFRSPLQLLLSLFRSQLSPLALKLEMEKIYLPKPDALPYRAELLLWIQELRKEGKKTLLLSASPDSWVQLIGAHLGVFDWAVGSREFNLKGAAKVQWLQKNLPGVPPSQIAYVGDSNADLELWKSFQPAGVVAPSPSLLRRLKKNQIPFFMIESRSVPRFISAVIQQYRVHHWVKNSLVFLPLFAAHLATDSQRLISTTLAFFSFSFLASAIYGLNDLADLDSDRRHPKKSKRPLASGRVSVLTGITLSGVLFVGSFVTACLLPWGFLVSLAGYLICNLLYTFWLKREIGADVVLLASLYSSRVIAGGFASQVEISNWLILFSIFLFLGLALVKRFSELHALEIRESKAARALGRGYIAEDRTILGALGVGSSFSAVVVFLFYLNGSSVTALYRQPQFLWLLAPLMVYWMCRVWILTARGLMNEDPIVFALKDRVSWGVGVTGCLIVLLAI